MRVPESIVMVPAIPSGRQSQLRELRLDSNRTTFIES